MTANACVLAEETISNKYIELIYHTQRDEKHTKVCLFHRSLINHPITGHVGGDLQIQHSRRVRIGMPSPSVFGNARPGHDPQASAPGGACKGKGKKGTSAAGGAGAAPGGSAPRGATVWRPKIRDAIPEDEMRKRFLTITAEESAQFSDVLVIRTPCCYSAHPVGWCQCMFCGALLQ